MKNFLYIFYSLFVFFASNKVLAQISGPTHVCMGPTYTYTYTGGTGSDPSCNIFWSVQGGTVVESTTFTTNTFPAYIKISWMYSSGAIAVNKCDGNWYTLNNIVAEDFPMTISPNSPSISQGSSITLTASTGYNYSWSCNSSNCISGAVTGQTVTATPSITTSYTATASIDFLLNGTDQITCTKSTSTNVTVVIAQLAGNTIGYDQGFCGSGDPAVIGQYSGTTLSGGTTPYSYQWQISTNGGATWSNISGATASTYDPTVITITSLYRRIVNPGASQSISGAVMKTVMPNTINMGSATYSSNTILKANQTVNITGNIATSSGASIVDIKAGEYILINTAGAIISSNSLMRIESCSNGFRYADHELHDQEAEEISSLVYPNPISEGTLYFGKNADVYQLFNSTGALVKEGVNVDSIEINELIKGMYFLRIDGVASKFIVQ